MERKKRDFLISIDPGITGSGVTVWDTSQKTIIRSFVVSKVIYPGKCLTYVNKWMNVHFKIIKLIQQYPPQKVVIEIPVTNYNRAGQKDSDIYKLSFLCGSLAGYCFERKIPVFLISPAEWKGSLPKRVTYSRVNKILGRKLISHSNDSAGIGIYFLTKRMKIGE